VIDRRIDWEPAGWLFGVVSLAVVLVLAIVVIGRSDILVFLAPLVGGLAGAWWSVRPERSIRVDTELSAERVFQGEPVTLTLRLTVPDGIEVTDLQVETGPELVAEPVTTRREPDGTLVATGELNSVRWGRCELRATAGCCSVRRAASWARSPCSRMPTASPRCPGRWTCPTCWGCTWAGARARAWSSPASGSTCRATRCGR
jgi:hypothetical protein